MTESASNLDLADDATPGELRTNTLRRVVLLVEDDVDVSEAAAMLLEEEGYDVLRAREGAEALRWLERVRPDVIVLDLMMPKMPGWAFFDEKQRRPELVDIPMIAWTATPVADARIGDTRLVRKDEGPEALLLALRDATERV